MKRNNKKIIGGLMSVILVFTMIFCFVGCGKTTSPAIGEGVVVDTEESSIETEEKVIPDGEVPAAARPAEETSATVKPADETTATTVSELEPTEPPHVHEYMEEVTRQATCAVAGEKTLTCECGDTKTEVIQSTGNHDWKEVTTVVNHPELGHVEQVQVGTTEGKTEYECGYCGARFDSPQAKSDHCLNSGDRNHAFSNTIAYDYPGEPIYEPQWVVDTPSWDETVVAGYTCTVCGATK